MKNYLNHRGSMKFGEATEAQRINDKGFLKHERISHCLSLRGFVKSFLCLCASVVDKRYGSQA
jgi:hypothetical protein